MTLMANEIKNSALDVSKYIICLAQRNGDIITNLKLQKLLYYAQAWYLVNNNNSKLFEDDIEAWQYGPVVPKVYNEFKSFGRKPIILDCDLERDFPDLSEDDKHYLNEFCEAFFRFSATELVAMTHQEKPWIEAINNGVHSIINTDTMYKFYTDMLNNG